MSDGSGPTEWSTGAAGVGPWLEEHPGVQPDDPRYDPELLVHGDHRNVVDAYRYWRRDDIVADIDRRRHRLHVAIENFGNDANSQGVPWTARHSPNPRNPRAPSLTPPPTHPRPGARAGRGVWRGRLF